MGDRTYTIVRVHKHTYNQLLHKYGSDDKIAEALGFDEVQDEGDEVEFHCSEANYGEIQPLEETLFKNKFEYDKSWEAGSEYGPGEMYCRVIKGEYKSYELQKDQEFLLTNLKQILKLPANQRTKKIEEIIKELEPFDPGPLKAPNSIDFIKNS